MKKYVFVILVLVLLSLSGCSCTPGGGTAAGEQTDVTTVTELPGGEPTQPNGTGNGQLHTAVAGEASVPDFERVFSFGDSEYESYLIWNDCEMTGVYLSEIAYSEDFSECYFTRRLCGWDSVKPSEALQLDIVIPEALPNSALTCTVNGETRTFILSYNGRDGGIWFSESDVKEAPPVTESVTAAPTGTSPAESGEVVFSIYLIDDNAEHLVCRETTIESRSAWHAWAALKRLNPCIPLKAGLNSFKYSDGTGTLDLGSGIYAANLGSTGEALMFQAIANTYIENYSLERLVITVDGAPYESGHFESADYFYYHMY